MGLCLRGDARLVFILLAGDFVREERSFVAWSVVVRTPLCAIALIAGLNQAAVAADAGSCAQVKNPGAYALQQKDTSVLQALSLAGGLTDLGSTARIKIVRIVKGEKQELNGKLGDVVQPGDTIIVRERFF